MRPTIKIENGPCARLPLQQTKNLANKKATGTDSRKAQWVSKFSEYTARRIDRFILTIGKILNPNATFGITPSLSLWVWSSVEVLQTRRSPGGPISGISVKSLTSQQENPKLATLKPPGISGRETHLDKVNSRSKIGTRWGNYRTY